MVEQISVLDKVRTAGKVGRIIMAEAVVCQYKTLAKLDTETLGKRLADKVVKADSTTLELGKIVVVLDQARDKSQYKTLKKWVKNVTGIEVQSEVYKAANSFAMVTFDTPAENAVFAGFITESEYDQTPIRWHYIVSSILNRLAHKDHKDDAILAAEVREQIAVVMRSLPKDGSEKLRGLLAALKGEEDEAGDENTPLTVEELSEIGKKLKNRIDITTDMAALAHASKVFAALSDYASGKCEAAPAPEMAAAA